MGKNKAKLRKSILNFSASDHDFDVLSYQILRSRLIEQYEHSPVFHQTVDHFRCAVRSGNATFNGLFGALLMAKELFVQDQEMRIHECERPLGD